MRWKLKTDDAEANGSPKKKKRRKRPQARKAKQEKQEKQEKERRLSRLHKPALRYESVSASVWASRPSYS